ncbi:META domain-containing protein [Oceanisphaera sp. KMM 10153]|uniref:META domain-containing protein n=1 Tax=Oceanisphaera submarina TaxID=3390193 RepID=UPI003974E442
MNRQTSFALAAVAAVAALSGCVAQHDVSQQHRLTGSLSYLSRIALATNSMAVVTVRDTSVADGAVIAEQRIDLDGRQLPISFNLAANTEDMTSGAYSLSAVIMENGQVSWRSAPTGITTEAGMTELGRLVLQQVSEDEGQVDAQLAGSAWQVRNLNGVDIPAAAEGSLNFSDDGRLHGRAFCNGFNGSYQLQGDKLDTAELATTMMLCTPKQMERERTMLDILGQSRRIELHADGTLVIFAADGRTLTAS